MKYKVKLIKEYAIFADSEEEAIANAKSEFDYWNDSSFCQKWDSIECKAESEDKE